jgi:hypothetical protein
MAPTAHARTIIMTITMPSRPDLLLIKTHLCSCAGVDGEIARAEGRAQDAGQH